jgi:hypothetical protein
MGPLGLLFSSRDVSRDLRRCTDHLTVGVNRLALDRWTVNGWSNCTVQRDTVLVFSIPCHDKILSNSSASQKLNGERHTALWEFSEDIRLCRFRVRDKDGSTILMLQRRRRIGVSVEFEKLEFTETNTLICDL